MHSQLHTTEKKQLCVESSVQTFKLHDRRTVVRTPHGFFGQFRTEAALVSRTRSKHCFKVFRKAVSIIIGLRNDLYCVEWDVKLLLYHATSRHF